MFSALLFREMPTGVAHARRSEHTIQRLERCHDETNSSPNSATSICRALLQLVVVVQLL